MSIGWLNFTHHNISMSRKELNFNGYLRLDIFGMWRAVVFCIDNCPPHDFTFSCRKLLVRIFQAIHDRLFAIFRLWKEYTSSCLTHNFKFCLNSFREYSRFKLNCNLNGSFKQPLVDRMKIIYIIRSHFIIHLPKLLIAKKSC